MQKDLIIQKEYAKITEIGKEKQENCVRIYCSDFPEGFTFQIRTFKPTTWNDKGVNRQMIASVTLTIDEVREILAYMEKEVSQ